MKLFDKIIKWSSKNYNAHFKKIEDKEIALPLFKKHLGAAKEAIEAFNKSEKTPKDLKDLFVVLSVSANQCSHHNDEYVRYAVHEKMYRKICDLICPPTEPILQKKRNKNQTTT